MSKIESAPSGINTGKVQMNIREDNVTRFPNPSGIGSMSGDLDDILNEAVEEKNKLREEKIEVMCKQAGVTREQFNAAMQIKRVESLIEKQLEDAAPTVPLELIRILEEECPFEERQYARAESEDKMQRGDKSNVSEHLTSGMKIASGYPTTLKPPLEEASE